MADPNEQAGAAPAAQPQQPSAAPAAPAPDDNGVSWDSTPDTTSLMSQATKLAGPLGGIALGGLQGAHASHNAGAGSDGVEWDDTPQTQNLMEPVKVRYAVPGKGIFDFTHGSNEEKTFLADNPQAAPRPYPTGEAYMALQDKIAKESKEKAKQAATVGAGALATVLTGGALAPVLEGTLGTGALAAAGEGAIVGAGAAGAGSVTRQAAEGENPFSSENIGGTAGETIGGGVLGGLFGAGGKLLTPLAESAKENLGLYFLKDGRITEQGVKDGIAEFLGKKTTPEIAQDAYDLLENQTPRPYSDIGNELKLIGPKLDARIASNEARVDGILYRNNTPIKNAAAQLTRWFDDLGAGRIAGMSRTGEQEAGAIEQVRNAVIPKMTDEMSSQEVNNVRKMIDDHIKTFDTNKLEPLDSAAKQAQEAYRMARFKLADIVKDANPATKPLFDQWSRDISVKDLLQSRYGQLQGRQAFLDSYNAYRKAAQEERIRAIKKVIGSRVAIGAGVGLGYHALNPFGHE